MTQDELKLVLKALEGWCRGFPDLIGDFDEQAITAIKKALAQTQEPVAWRKREVGGGWQYYGWEETGMTYEAVNRFNKNGFECEAIPATPPQRTWVGLTDDDVDLLEELYAPPVHPDFVNDADHCLELIRHVEAKLKQKNGFAEENT